MNDFDHALLRRSLWATLGLALLALLATGLTLHATEPARAQAPLGLAITKTLNGSSTVRVGEVLTFTIRITNTGTLSITELVVVDTFESSIVAPAGSGPFARPNDPPLTEPAGQFDGNATITWTLFSPAQPLRPGEATTLLVRLRAVRPTAQLQTVNRARIERAIRSDGGDEGGSSAEAPAEPSGARLPMSKTLGVPQPVRAGLPITFTIVITNDGAIDLVALPLRDVYNPAALQFTRSDPPPSAVNATTGVLDWSDLLVITGRGRLRPGEAITVTTTYLALQGVQAAVNRAEVAGARDEYGNALALRQAEAPIRVLPADETPRPTVPAPATATPTAGATAPATPTVATAIVEPTETPTPLAPAGPRLTEIAARTPTPAATATDSPIAVTPEAVGAAPIETPEAVEALPDATPALPAALPPTGARAGRTGGWLLIGLALLLAGLALHGRRRANPPRP